MNTMKIGLFCLTEHLEGSVQESIIEQLRLVELADEQGGFAPDIKHFTRNLDNLRNVMFEIIDTTDTAEGFSSTTTIKDNHV